VHDPPPSPQAATPERPRASPRLRAEELFRNTDEIEILLGAETYRLRLTRNGKLILTK
jgi:hemin uptake protein HemP